MTINASRDISAKLVGNSSHADRTFRPMSFSRISQFVTQTEQTFPAARADSYEIRSRLLVIVSFEAD